MTGIELSQPMVNRLRRRVPVEELPVVIGDMATTTVPGQFSLVYVVWNSIGNLCTQDEQVQCFRNAARHLAPGGRFVVELWVPGIRRFPPGQSAVPYEVTDRHVGFDTYDMVTQQGPLTTTGGWTMGALSRIRQALSGGTFGRLPSLAVSSQTRTVVRLAKGALTVFVQVIQGQVSDAGQARAALDRWVQELAPGATGWLGSTAGVTEDGRFIALARFESEEVARRNSDRPEQDRWWAETAKLFTDDATFRDSSDVVVDVIGDPDQAGFVQVIQGRGTDPDRARALMAQDSEEWAAFRPDIIGSVGTQYDGGAYTMALYFTSEEAAREGERKDPPPALKAQMDEMNALSIGVPEFLDLKQPWLYSPR